jgi:hypothetical protein
MLDEISRPMKMESNFLCPGKWNRLPYSYNVRRNVYYPMKGEYIIAIIPAKSLLFSEHHKFCMLLFSAYHFAGYGITPKPWELKKPPSRKEANSFPGPIIK